MSAADRTVVVDILDGDDRMIGQREVKRACVTCDRSDEIDLSSPPILSPSGVAHHSDGYARTFCGHDAPGTTGGGRRDSC